MKALALIGHPEDGRRIGERLKVEGDLETQTWGVASLLKSANERGLDEVCKEVGLESSASIALAAQLYAPRKWVLDNPIPVRIAINSDILTLKWATFLIGYGRAPLDLFDPRHSNDVFLGELNRHDSADIREYSVWALWKRQEFNAGASRIALCDARRHPDSVRKWIYRLAAQSPDLSGLDIDALREFRNDNEPRAREGLALGVGDLDPRSYGDEVLDWYTDETNSRVRENLLSSMANQAAHSDDYRYVVSERYRAEARGSALRQRLLAASVGTPLFFSLKDVEAKERGGGQLELMPVGSTIIVQSGGTMTQFNAGRDNVAQNMVGGDMVNSAHAAVQNLDQASDLAAVLKEVLDFIKVGEAGDAQQEVAAAVRRRKYV